MRDLPHSGLLNLADLMDLTDVMDLADLPHSGPRRSPLSVSLLPTSDSNLCIPSTHPVLPPLSPPSCLVLYRDQASFYAGMIELVGFGGFLAILTQQVWGEGGGSIRSLPY